jgi:predicted dehydrogenase
MSVDFCRRDAVRTCSVHGKEGTLFWDGINQKVTWQSGGGMVETETFSIERDEMFSRQIEHFLRCVESGEKPKVTIDDAAEVLKLVEAARKADKENRAVFL